LTGVIGHGTADGVQADHGRSKDLTPAEGLKGEDQLPKVIAGVTFQNGVEMTGTPKQSAVWSPRHPLSRIVPLTRETDTDLRGYCALLGSSAGLT
jgi:hypothetical protein